MQLFLVRHGETDWNATEIFRGRFDIELNQRGIEQALLTSKAFDNVPLDVVYSSPLSRAYDTASQIARQHGLQVAIEASLTDIDYGAWQGVSHEQVKNECPGLYQLWNTAPQKVRFEGGESLDDVRKRAADFLGKLAGRHPGQNVVAVSHRVFNKVVLCYILGLDNSHFWKIRQDTCAINVIEHTGLQGFMIRHLNETNHIRTFAEEFATGADTKDF